MGVPTGCFPVLDQCPHSRVLLWAQEYGPEADLWSVGMLTYQLLTGGFPFWDNVQNLTLQQARAVTLSCSSCRLKRLSYDIEFGKSQQGADTSSPHVHGPDRAAWWVHTVNMQHTRKHEHFADAQCAVLRISRVAVFRILKKSQILQLLN